MCGTGSYVYLARLRRAPARSRRSRAERVAVAAVGGAGVAHATSLSAILGLFLSVRELERQGVRLRMEDPMPEAFKRIAMIGSPLALSTRLSGHYCRIRKFLIRLALL